MKPVTWAGIETKDNGPSLLRDEKLPIRLAVNGSKGFPVIASLWFLFDDDRLLCATQPDSAIAKCIQRDPRCTFEISTNSPPYTGVRGVGNAVIKPEGGKLLKLLIKKYLKSPDERFRSWLIEKGANDVVIEIEAAKLKYWDYKSRMKDSA